MKRILLLSFLLVSLVSSLFSQNIERISTAEKVYLRDELGLVITALFPDECTYFWSGIFAPKKTPCYVDSIELAFAFERYNPGLGKDDSLYIEIYEADINSKGLLKRFYRYTFNLGNLGFPERWSAKETSPNWDTRPTFYRTSLGPKKVKITGSSFAIGFRVKSSVNYTWDDKGKIWLQWYGLNTSRLEINASNQSLKPYSRRYRIDKANQSSSSFDQSFTSINSIIYMNAFVTDQAPSNSSNIIDKADIPKYECDQILEVENKEYKTPETFQLNQNYPNPFNPTTNITYQIPIGARVQINILNVLGQKIMTLIDTKQDQGQYTIPFDPKNLSGGVYFYQINVYDKDKHLYSNTKKMVYLK